MSLLLADVRSLVSNRRDEYHLVKSVLFIHDYSIRIIQMPVKVGKRSDLGLFGVIRKCHSDGHKRERKRGLCSGFLLYISFISVYFPRSLFKAPLIQMHFPCKQQKETTLQ